MKFRVNREVESASGSQEWETEADSIEEAFENLKEGIGDIVENDVEVTNLEPIELNDLYEYEDEEEIQDPKVWTDKPPEKRGWYWIDKGGQDGIDIVHVFVRPGHKYWAIWEHNDHGNGCYLSVNCLGANWAGPISEPRE